ncbi:MAG: tRNA lysidine(34) synthetase TilS [Acidobacteriota bacterium]
MLAQVLTTVARHNLLAPGQRVIAAVSGGPDSVCLLHVLRELAPQVGFELAGVAHFNHKLRAGESEEDQRFVAQIAAELGLAFYPQSGPQTSGNLEQSLRRARRAFFRDLIQGGAGDRVALGHTRDDQAETVLFRMLRGSGSAGLAGILPLTAEGLIRPLLEVSREQVIAFLRDRGIAWREDASNQSDRFARNRIRHRLLPQLAAEWNPNIRAGLAQFADLAYQEELWWAGEIAAQAGQLLVTSPGRVEFRAEQVAALPLAVARRLVRHAVVLAKGDLKGVEFGHVEKVLELAATPAGEGRCALPGLDAVRSFGFVSLYSPHLRPEPIAVKVPGEYSWDFDNMLIRLDLAESPQQREACVTLGVLAEGDTLKLRAWQPGDRYRPAGSAREQKLKDLFQKARVPSWRRVSWPILTVRDKILWAKGFGVSAEHSVARRAGIYFRIWVEERNTAISTAP